MDLKEIQLSGFKSFADKTTIRFEEGVARTLDYVLGHKECQKDDPEFDAWCDKVIETLENAKKAF